MSSCYAQQVISETNLFEWANGSVIQKPMFIEIDRQPSEDVLSSHTFPIYHSFPAITPPTDAHESVPQLAIAITIDAIYKSLEAKVRQKTTIIFMNKSQ